MPAKKQQQNTDVVETEVIAESDSAVKSVAAKPETKAAAGKTAGAKSTAAGKAATAGAAGKSTAAQKSSAVKSTGSKAGAAKPAAAKSNAAAKTAAAQKSTTAKAAGATGTKSAAAKSATTAKSTGAKKSNAAKPAARANAAAETTATADVKFDAAQTARSVTDAVAQAENSDAAAIDDATVSVADETVAKRDAEERDIAKAGDGVQNATEDTVAAPAATDGTFAAETSGNTPVASGDAILRVEGLKKYFPIKTNFFGKPTRYLKAVDDVSFAVEAGKTIGVVGESGCGKTTLGRTILKLYDSDGGKISFDGNDITGLTKKQMMKYRTQMQLIFQDPYSSLPPRMTIGQIISEPVAVHKIVPKSELYDYVQGVMKQCGLQPQYYDRYPHEFSGGQRQRICIARALAVKPKLVICDEPVSALDVSIQAQIINLLKDLQRSMGLTYVFISHDLSVVKYITDQILVMYLGNSMEFSDTDEIFENPLHPYTQALFSAVPAPDPTVKMNRIILAGDIPSPANPPEGCKFHTRCSKCMDVCKFKAPETVEARRGHFVACHLYNEQVMSKLDEYSQEYARLEEEKRIRQEEARAKKENGKLYKLKKKVVGLFRKPKPDGSHASVADSRDGASAANADGNADAATEQADEKEEKQD